jgi:hypothetical protein
MFVRKIASFASVVALLALATGCAAEAASYEETADTGSALIDPSTEGTFNLYEASAQPNATCDVHTVLELVHLSRDGELQARLHEAVEGVCEIFVIPDNRGYTLKLESTNCGSRIYKGTSTGGAHREITVTDHRDRFCRDIVTPAQIIVSESPVNGGARMLHSYDEGPNAK